jgi:squalene-associated FAD-dependent desaturase
VGRRPSDTFDVAVIGGGVAGLAAATALAEAGTRVIVLEARGQLGGRATAFRDRETGELVDNGQHVLFGCYHETFRFLRRIDAMSNVAVQPTLEVPYLDETGRRTLFRCPAWPSPLHLLGGVFGWDALPMSEKLGSLRLAPDLMLKRTPDGTVADWLTRRGQRGRIRDWLWEPLAVAALNQAPEEAAAAPFVHVLSQMFGASRTDASIALPTRPLHEMYALPAQRFIESRGGAVRLDALARVRLAGGRVAGVDVRGEPIDVSRVIAAVPWFALEPLLVGDATPMADVISAASRMTAKPIVTVNLWYDRPVMDQMFVGLPGREIQWVFDKRRAFGETASHLSLVVSGADAIVDRTTADLVALAAAEVAAALPGARAATLRRGTVVRERRATFSLAPGEPARPGVTTPVEGLTLAGDWFDTGLPGTIESAAVAGHMAADAALRTSAASEPRARSAPAKRRARARVGATEGRRPSDLT